MPLPDTHIQKRLGGCGCAPDESVLFGPSITSTESHFFTVGDMPVALELYDHSGEAVVTFERITDVCGEIFVKPARNLCGDALEMDAAASTLLVTQPGRYRALLAGADPEDIVLEWVEIRQKVIINTSTCGGGGGGGTVDLECDTVAVTGVRTSWGAVDTPPIIG